MKKSLIRAGCAALSLMFMAEVASAGPIMNACLRSERKSASQELCGCIQKVANITLRGSDQRRAAKFFADPDMANEVKLSKSSADDAFWARYKLFSQQAEIACAG